MEAVQLSVLVVAVSHGLFLLLLAVNEERILFFLITSKASKGSHK